MAKHHIGSREANLSPSGTIQQVLSRPQPKKQNLRLFKTSHKDTGKSLISRPASTKSGRKGQQLAPLKTMVNQYQMLTSFKNLANRVKELNPRYMVPVNEASLVIPDPETVKMAQPVKEQPLSGPPPKGSRFSPIYVEPGPVSIDSTRDLQALFPNSFDCIGDMSGEYDIKTDLTVLPVQHGRCKVPIEYKDEIEKEFGEMVQQGIIARQTRVHTMGQFIDVSQKRQMAS